MVSLPFELKVNRSVPFSEERLFMCFDELGLEHELYFKRVNEVSGGQRQRIMLMITALLNKKIVLLDEPTSALDPDSISLIIDYIHAMRETTVVMVSHDTRFIEAFDRKIYIGD